MRQVSITVARIVSATTLMEVSGVLVNLDTPGMDSFAKVYYDVVKC